MKRLTGMLLLVFAGATGAADPVVKGIEVSCNRDEFVVQDYNLVNGIPQRRQRAGSTVLNDFKEHQVKCVVNGHDILAEIQLYPPTEQHECGGKPPGGRLTLVIDREKYLNHADINACFDTLNSVRVAKYANPTGTFAIELCGRTNPNFMPRFDGCVNAVRDDLRKTAKPLNRRFPVADLLKAMKF